MVTQWLRFWTSSHLSLETETQICLLKLSCYLSPHSELEFGVKLVGSRWCLLWLKCMCRDLVPSTTELEAGTLGNVVTLQAQVCGLWKSPTEKGLSSCSSTFCQVRPLQRSLQKMQPKAPSWNGSSPQQFPESSSWSSSFQNCVLFTMLLSMECSGRNQEVNKGRQLSEVRTAGAAMEVGWTLNAENEHKPKTGRRGREGSTVLFTMFT